ncbi:TIGR01906 family membrane protein [Aquifex pyrophilus]
MRKLIPLILVLIFPYVSIGVATRIAFTEKFVEWEYSKRDFPPDRWGMKKEERLELAKLGLKAVLSDEGMEEFKKKRLRNGRKAFTKREVKHMEDVKKFLSFYFPSVYIATALWILGVIILRKPDILILSGLFNTFLLVFLGILTFTNYKRAFEIFHNIVFDPYSWKFKYSDTLIRIYPLKFWYDATLFVAFLSFLFGLLVAVAGMVWKKRGLKP